MLTIVCGEDIVTSRKYLNRLREEYTRSNTEIKDIPAADIREILGWLGNSMGLFSAKSVFFTEKMEALIIRKRGRKASSKATGTFEDAVREIAKRKDIHLVDWEAKQGRDIKMKDDALVKEFKPAETVFKLLELCVPGKLEQFVTLLRSLTEDQDETFLQIMLTRHIRSLILASENQFAATVAPWQRGKLAAQARMWKQNALVDFYEGIYRLETTTRTGANPHGVRKTLEILACYYL